MRSREMLDWADGIAKRRIFSFAIETFPPNPKNFLSLFRIELNGTVSLSESLSVQSRHVKSTQAPTAVSLDLQNTLSQ